MPVIRAVLFSSGFHILALLLVVWLAPFFAPKAPPETIQVELYPEGRILEALTPEKDRRQVVRQALVPEKLKAPEDETLAKLLSQQKQRVHKETQAPKSGMTANRDNTPGMNDTQPVKPVSPKAKNEASQERDPDGYKPVDITDDLQEMNRLEGMSTVGDRLDVKVGSFTALNTDRHLFYSFYSRMEELVRFRWETRVMQAMEALNPAIAPRGTSAWETQVEFLLDKQGYVQKAKIMKLSGMPSFDLTGVAAFKDARVIPNPPPEMIQEDGFIHLTISFTVNYNPKWFARQEEN